MDGFIIGFPSEIAKIAPEKSSLLAHPGSSGQADEWYITNICGVMRKKQAALGLVKLIQQQPQDVAFYGVPEARLANGQYSCYLAFLEISIPKASTHALDIGKFVDLSWCHPEIEQGDPPQSKWKGQVFPPLPDPPDPIYTRT